MYFGLVFVLSSLLLRCTQGPWKDQLPPVISGTLLPRTLFVLALPMKLILPEAFADHTHPGVLSALWVVNGVIWGIVAAGFVIWLRRPGNTGKAMRTEDPTKTG